MALNLLCSANWPNLLEMCPAGCHREVPHRRHSNTESPKGARKTVGRGLGRLECHTPQEQDTEDMLWEEPSQRHTESRGKTLFPLQYLSTAPY